MVIPVILCGGYGAHLWPLSRELFPKQVISIMGGEHSLLQQTVARLSAFHSLGDPIVTCNEEHRFMAAAQIQSLQVKPRAIILEARARNTAPATLAATLEGMSQGEDPLLLIFPVDHYFEDITPLVQAVEWGLELAEQGMIVSFGITPTKPAVRYGYMEKGEKVPVTGASDTWSAFRVRSFCAAPTMESASLFAVSGHHLWNSGILLFRASVFFEEMKAFAPEVLDCCLHAHAGARRDMDFLRLDSDALEACPSASLDIALMEKTNKAVVIPLDTQWRDLGAWSDLYEVQTKDESGNVIIGDVVIHNVHNSYLHADSRMLAAVGLDRHVIIETKDAVFVAPFDAVEDVSVIVRQLKESHREEAIVHSKVYRPWGAYECIDLGDRFQVKRITVNPGSKLSLQKHFHRAEHWVIVRGTAIITRGDEKTILTENQSTFVPLGTVHRLENPGRIPLEIIEIQTGSYLKEDDIVRFDDVYGRAGETTP